MVQRRAEAWPAEMGVGVRLHTPEYGVRHNDWSGTQYPQFQRSPSGPQFADKCIGPAAPYPPADRKSSRHSLILHALSPSGGKTRAEVALEATSARESEATLVGSRAACS